tara:strand:- start:1861 stop:2952 length:1092 start_codon:yes stop_codon:yes gene_type:complete
MITYRFNTDDAIKALGFVKEYHLEPSKSPTSRTNQGKRGLGGEIDDFLIKGLTEIAVCKIIGKYNKDIKLLPDFNVYTDRDVAEFKDPDITEIYDFKSKVKRKPKLHIEIKISDKEKDNWLFARIEQVQHIFDSKKSGYMIHVSLDFDDEKTKKEQSITGSVLREVVNKESFPMEEFSNISDLIATIEFAYSYDDLKEKGMYFPDQLIMPKTTFDIVNRGPYKRDGKLSEMFELICSLKGANTISMKTIHSLIGSPDISLFNPWEIKGNVELYKKVQNNYNDEYIFAVEDSTMENKNIGRFNLKKGQTYRFHLENALGKSRAGGEQVKQNKEFAFSKTKLTNIYSDIPSFTLENICRQIAKNI